MSDSQFICRKSNFVVTVIISTFNDNNLSNCLRSLSLQTFKSFKIILINDGGKDVSEIVQNFPKMTIDYYTFTDNQGLAARLNFAIKLVDTDFIARIDSDDFALPERLELQYDYLSQNRYDLVGCSVISHYNNGKFKIQHNLSNEQSLINHLKYRIPLAHPTFFGKSVVFTTLFYSSDLTYSQDYDFLARAVLTGFRIGNLPIPLLIYNVSELPSFNKVFFQVRAAIAISSAYSKSLGTSLPYALNYSLFRTNILDRIVARVHFFALKPDLFLIKVFKYLFFFLVSIISPLFVRYNTLILLAAFAR